LKSAARKKIVCYVTDRKSLIPTEAEARAAKILGIIRQALDAGVDWIHIREKDLPAQELLEFARQALQMAAHRAGVSPRPARIFINDRLDVAVAAGAQGVHLGYESAMAGDVVGWCRAGHAPTGFAIGVSCHRLEEVLEAANAGVDYVFFGPIFETPSKKEFGVPQGIQKLAQVCRAVPRIEVIAIGGINAENAGSCICSGASGIAAIRMFQESRDFGGLRDAVTYLHDLGTQEESL